MSSYLYELPTTGAISFADFCVDQSSDKAYISAIAEATQTRASLRAALKESKHDETGEKDYLKLVKIIDDYLPHLRGIMVCVASGQITLSSEPQFSWRTTLSSTRFPGQQAPRVDLPSLHADYAATLLTYGFALSNLAHATTSALGSYESARATADAERRAKDDKVAFAAALLCRASGVFSFISERVIPAWPSAPTRPPDWTRDLTAALAKLALADAQTLAIRKLLSRAAYDSSLAPGPPLPKSHPAPALLAKLHLEAAALATAARALASSADTRLLRYLGDAAALHAALARKWFGVDAGEAGRGGEAVAWLTWARRSLEAVRAPAVRREKSAQERAAAVELEAVGAFLVHYRKINDSLTFEVVPAQTELQARVPAGRLAVAVRPFAEPAPAFGPGSVEDARRKAEALAVGTEAAPVDATTSPATGTYVGAGSYF